jgi:serine/threonine protein kinase
MENMLLDKSRRAGTMTQPSTVLFLAANPAVPELQLGKECQAIEDRIRAARFRDQLRLRARWAARADDLLQALHEHEPAVLHFSGHGAGMRGLCFLDERGDVVHVSSDGLGQVIRAAGDGIKLIVFNACYTKVQAEALVTHVPCVIGMPHAIDDDAAIVYAANFYCALAFGKSVGNAHQCGLAALALRSSEVSPLDITRDIVAAKVALQNAVPEVLTRRGVDAKHIYIVHGVQADDSMDHPLTGARVHVEITFDTDLERFSEEALARTIGEVRRLIGGRSVKIICVTKGSVKLTISVDEIAAAKLLELRQKDQLNKIGEFAISDVAGFESVESYVHICLTPSNMTEEEEYLSESPWPNIAVSNEIRRRPTEPLFERSQFRVGRYALLGWIGSGGAANVYKAYDEQVDRHVAIKLPRASGAFDSRLLREAQALARISHPNVIQLYDLGIHDSLMFLAMEFVPGKTLTRWLDEVTFWPWPQRQQEVLHRFIAAGRALEAAHAAGVVHRDFKPDNILVRDDGRVRLIDFGSAHILSAKLRALQADDRETPQSHMSVSRLRVSGGVVGTLRYMAPEQIRGENPNPRSDQFSFCVSLYNALTGVSPFPGIGLSEILESMAAGPARFERSAHVPTRLQQVLRRGLSLEPSQRFASMGALLEELEANALPRRKRPASLFAATLAAVMGLVVVGGMTASDLPRLVSFSSLLFLSMGAAAGYLVASWSSRKRHEAERIAVPSVSPPVPVNEDTGTTGSTGDQVPTR